MNKQVKPLSVKSIIGIIIIVIYAIWPLDIITDAMPLFGIADDAALGVIVVNSVVNDIKKYRTKKKNEEVSED